VHASVHARGVHSYSGGGAFPEPPGGGGGGVQASGVRLLHPMRSQTQAKSIRGGVGPRGPAPPAVTSPFASSCWWIANLAVPRAAPADLSPLASLRLWSAVGTPNRHAGSPHRIPTLGPALRLSKVDGARRPEGLEEAAIVRHQHDRAYEPFERRFELFDRL
jgi:hypothetical protein